MKTVRVLSLLNLLSLLVHMGMATAVQFRWFNRLNVGEVSNLYPSLFTPAGITFSIWSLIYIALLLFTAYHCRKAFSAAPDHEANAATRRIGPWFLLNQLLTAGWLFAFTQQWIGWSEVLILLQLVCLVIVHGILGIQEPQHSVKDKVFTQAPLSIYLGWISIATIANTAAYLVSVNWTGWNLEPAMWTVLMIGAALVLTLLMIFLRNNIIFGVVVIWALAGIIIRQYQLHDFYPSIIKAAWTGIGFTILAILVQLFRIYQYHPGSNEPYLRRELRAGKSR